MPFEPAYGLGGIAPGDFSIQADAPDNSFGLGTSIAAATAVGAGLFFAPEITIPALAFGGGAAYLNDPKAFGAAFRTQNTIGSYLSSASPPGEEPDPNFDVWGRIAGTPYQHYYEQFIDTRNERHFEAIKSQIDRERADREYVSQAGISGLTASFAAGIFDWPTLLPAGQIVRTAKGSVSLLRTAAATGMAGAGAAALQEAALHATQHTRTGEESAYAIGGAAILSGVLGAGISRRIASHEMEALAKKTEEYFTVSDLERPDPLEPGAVKVTVPPAKAGAEALLNKTETPPETVAPRSYYEQATSLGAAAAKAYDDTLKSAFGLEKVLSFQDPVFRLQRSISPVSKRVVQELAETPLVYEKNVLGQETAPEGSALGTPGAAESRMKLWKGQLSEAENAIDDAFFEYRKGRVERSPGELSVLKAQDLVSKPSALRFTEFKEAISEAMRNNDTHDIPQVANMAKYLRAKIFDPLKDQAVSAKLLPDKDLSVKTAESYLARVWNKDLIIAERDQVRKEFSAWLGETEDVNRSVRDRLIPLLERHDVLEKRIARHEKDLEHLTESTGKTEIRQREASGLNQFAFSRSAKLSEPLDKLREQIEGISNRVRDELDRINELIASIRGERSANFPELEHVESQMAELARLLPGAGKKMELIDAVKTADRIDASIADLAKSFSGIMKSSPNTSKALVELKKAGSGLSKKVRPFQQELTRLNKELRAQENRKVPGAKGGAVFETKIRGRVNSLADQASGKKKKIEVFKAKIKRSRAELDGVKGDIESAISEYQGMTTSEAISHMIRRDKAEAARTPEQRARQPRLTTADASTLSAARKVASRLDKEPGEIGNIADQIIDRIIGHPDGRLPYDAHMNRTETGGVPMNVRGPLAPRVFLIPDARVTRWLENDIEKVLRHYVRTMSADVEIARRFGDVDMTMPMKEIEDFYAKLSTGATTPAERNRIEKWKKTDRTDLAAIRDRLRGMYNVPSDPSSLMVRIPRVVRSLNYLTKLGSVLLTMIVDIGGIVLRHGVLTVADGLIPLLRNWHGARLSARETKLSGTALDMVHDSRAMSIGEVMDDFGRFTKFERMVGNASRAFGVLSLMAPWTAFFKQFTGMITMTGMLRACERFAAGKASKKEIERLAAGYISASNAMRIAEQFALHGKKDRGVWLPNTVEWDASARSAVEAFRVALSRDVDRVIVTPGQDRPLWMSTELGRQIGQFKSFPIAATQRVLVAGLQQHDMAMVQGFIMMIALGGLSNVLRAKISGQPSNADFSTPKKIAATLQDAIDRSGVLGWMMDANNILEKSTNGAVGLSAFTGRSVSRYASRNTMGALLGPTAGTFEDFRTVGAKATGYLRPADKRGSVWSETETRAVRRIIPFNNIFYVRSVFDRAEAGINAYFGIPKTGRKN